MPKISVIVPVYNVENYIGKCIESILCQTFTDLELILVDDGSTDASGQICENYKQTDKRIKVFHKENGGVSAARNFGLENAAGEWICFVDSDDWIDPTYLDDFNINDSEAELYMQGYVKMRAGVSIDDYGFEKCSSNYLGDIIGYAENHYIINSPCFKLYNRSIIKQRGLVFDTNTSFGEDHLFTLDYIQYIENVSFSLSKGYIYRLRESLSLTQRIVPIKEHIYYLSKCLDKSVSFFHKHGSLTLLHAISERYIQNLKVMLRDWYLVGANEKDYRDAIQIVKGNGCIDVITLIAKFDKVLHFIVTRLPLTVSYYLLKNYCKSKY